MKGLPVALDLQLVELAFELRNNTPQIFNGRKFVTHRGGQLSRDPVRGDANRLRYVLE